MATNTKTRKKTTPTKTRVKVTKRKPTVKAKPVPRVIGIQSIPGLSGQGLLSLGGKTKLELREVLAMPRPMFGRVVDVSERTIADAESGKTAKKLMRTYNEVYRLVEALSEVVDRESLGLWFRTPNEAFGDLKPIEVIERGEIDRLWNMVFQLRTGMPS